ncbi:hypothetical protein [Streptomyces sp. NPDC088554]|uniref:hypothetical protein n=1 Tax=Streptomyces sp. NPDC088554 TaxID=3365865 RepID=UPI0037FA7147
MSNYPGMDSYWPTERKRPPVQCIKCRDTAVILSQAKHPESGEWQWRLTCLDCRVAWPQDQHGGSPDEYM